MSACSRCGSLWPVSDCYVCCKEDEPEEEGDTFPDLDDEDHDVATERLLDRADYLRTERKDRQMEEAWESRKE
jgi:hypothetical protein